MAIYKKILQAKSEGKKLLTMLIDPDSDDIINVFKGIDKAIEAHVDYFFVGGSLLHHNKLSETISFINSKTQIPVLLFPGNIMQIDAKANGVILPSVISGRNPDLLIGKHVEAAAILKSSQLDIIPTGYMLIDSGVTTTVNYMSNTQPIPFYNNAVAVSTAIAGEMLGLKMLYLEAGSGAPRHVSLSMIKAVSQEVHIPIIVGGGIKSPEAASAILSHGADMVVIGNALENDSDLIFDLSTSVHSSTSKSL